jgi:hypothetical protein
MDEFTKIFLAYGPWIPIFICAALGALWALTPKSMALPGAGVMAIVAIISLIRYVTAADSTVGILAHLMITALLGFGLAGLYRLTQGERWRRQFIRQIVKDMTRPPNEKNQ